MFAHDNNLTASRNTITELHKMVVQYCQTYTDREHAW